MPNTYTMFTHCCQEMETQSAVLMPGKCNKFKAKTMQIDKTRTKLSTNCNPSEALQGADNMHDWETFVR